jgi:hypothetical protein
MIVHLVAGHQGVKAKPSVLVWPTALLYVCVQIEKAPRTGEMRG